MMPAFDARTLSEEIEAAAKEAGVTVTALCRSAGIARSTFSRWKAGRTEPQFRIYRKLMDALGTISDITPRARVTTAVAPTKEAA